MDLATLIVSCSLVSSPLVQDTLMRVVLAHSAGHPHTIVNTSTQTSYTPKTSREAAHIAAQLHSSHHRVKLGLAALPAQRLASYKLSMAEALEPCTNIALASLELGALLGAKAHHIGDGRLHKKLALYYEPDNPGGFAAIEWGAKILAYPKVSLSAQLSSSAPLASRQYQVQRFRRLSLSQNSERPGRLMLKQAQGPKAKLKPKAPKPDKAQRPQKLGLEDLSPKDPIKKPVTNKRLP